MHPCLQLDEMLSLIATLVGGNDRTATLSKMALTCKRFNGPAVDALWEEIPGLLPLLPLLPPEAYVVEQKRGAWVLVRDCDGIISCCADVATEDHTFHSKTGVGPRGPLYALRPRLVIDIDTVGERHRQPTRHPLRHLPRLGHDAILS